MSFDPNQLYYYMAKTYAKEKREDNKIIFCNEGSSRCFDSQTIICTPLGDKKICDLKIDDLVYTYNHKTKETEFKKVIDLIVTKNTSKKCFNIKLKNGTEIKCTEDHKFFFNGEYQEIKNILSLLKNNI